MNCDKLIFDVAVIGGGMGGLCAAIASARNGANTILIQDRPVLGGNASSEIRMHITGALGNEGKSNRRETGIIEEILLENKYRNPDHSYAIFDSILWEKARFQENLTLYLNTYMTDVEMRENHIVKIFARQLTTEKKLEISADIFVDATGDGILSYLAGAEFMYGREEKSQFLEEYAVGKADTLTMGNSIQFHAIDMGHPVRFERPEWAYDYSDAEWVKKFSWTEITSGYWWLEIGGTSLNAINDSEETKDELLKIVYGIWDYIKNHSARKQDAENLMIDWVGMIPAKRESRRIIGDYILNENDLYENKKFYDAVAYGGWHIDSHQPEKFINGIVNGIEPVEDVTRHLPDIYQIPYRCLYSKNIENLMLGGRLISASHRAFASTRVMSTCSVCGQAVGTAAAMAVERGINPRDVLGVIEQLQQKLLRDDCYIPDISNTDINDKARNAKVSCSGERPGYSADFVINGVARTVGDNTNLWASDMSKSGAFICLRWDEEQSIKELRITFDSNLSVKIMQSISDWIIERQSREIPDTIVSDYRVEFYRKKSLVKQIDIVGNYQRLNVHHFDEIVCDSIRITIMKTNGSESARIFEVRAY